MLVVIVHSNTTFSAVLHDTLLDLWTFVYSREDSGAYVDGPLGRIGFPFALVRRGRLSKEGVERGILGDGGVEDAGGVRWVNLNLLLHGCHWSGIAIYDDGFSEEGTPTTASDAKKVLVPRVCT